MPTPEIYRARAEEAERLKARGGEARRMGLAMERPGESQITKPQLEGLLQREIPEEELAQPRTRVLTGPDGKKHILEVPEGATEEEIVQAAQRAAAHLAKGDNVTPSPDPKPYQGEPHQYGNFFEEAGALLDAGASIAAGAVGEPFAGINGLLHSVGRNAEGEWGLTPDSGAAAVGRVRERFSRSPSSVRGAETLETVGEAFSKIEQGADWLAVNLSGGNPVAATAIKTTLLGLPAVLGAKTGIGRRRAIKQKKAEIETFARENGINLNPRHLKETLLEAMDKRVSHDKGAAFPPLQQAVRAAKEASGKRVDAAYNTARSTPAYVRNPSVQKFRDHIKNELIDRQQFDVGDMPILTKRLTELDEIAALPGTGTKLALLDKYRQRINANFPRSADRLPEQAALNGLKKGLDEFIDAEFNARAIKGDPSAIKAWKDARGTAATHAKNFKADNFIKQMIKSEATPEQFRQWMVGAGSMTAKPIVGQTIRRLKEILGKDSPQFEALRQDFLFDVARPLWETPGKPNFQKFVANYDRLIVKNPTMVKELNLNSASLRQMRDFAQAAHKVDPGVRFGVTKADATKALSRFFIGHSIARAALRVKVGTAAMDILFHTGKTARKQIMSELTGIDVTAPLIPRKSVLAGGVFAEQTQPNDR